MSGKVSQSILKRGVQLLLLVAATFLVWGCNGSSSFDTPQETGNAAIGGAASNVLIEAATLHQWVDAGLVNNTTDYGDKVVVLDFNGSGDLIPGAIRVTKAELMNTRFEGVADATNMVASGEMMDAVIQRLGIDQNTVIVFTGSNIWYQARAYWTFRYWGFPKSCLRILNGLNAAYAGYGLVPELAQPTPVATKYSVRNLAQVNENLRASISEMIPVLSQDLTTSTTDIVFDARGAGATSVYVGSPTTTAPALVFNGHPAGGLAITEPGNVYDAANKYMSAADLAALFGTANWQDTKKATVYCTTGVVASSLFVALDAILGKDVQLYDGSWNQLGLYSDNGNAGGQLPLGSLWAVDGFMDPLTLTYNAYNYIAPATPASIAASYDVTKAQTVPFTGNVPANDTDVVPSQIEVADAIAAPGGATAIPAPVATATPGVLIDGGTLFGWANAGLVNKPSGERVVIVDVSAAADYAAGHIPGAFNWPNSSIIEARYEGPLSNSAMVLSAANFQAKLQAAGIDENTTVVLTSAASSTVYYPSRIYFHFRYWGFPKDRIKMLNGQNAGWPAELLTSTVPMLTPSTLTLAALATGAQTQLRASLAEMMDAARDLRGTPVDLRGDSTAAGATSTAVFNGTLNGGRNLLWSGLFDGVGDWKSVADLTAVLAANGITLADYTTDGSFATPVLPYCTKGFLGSYGFFLFDGILGLDTMLYDGSWSQWGSLSDNATMGGELANYGLEAWAVDNSTYMSQVNYSVNRLDSPANVITPLNPNSAALALDPTDAAANQIETSDHDYQIQAPAVDSSSTGQGGTTTNPYDDGNLGGGC